MHEFTVHFMTKKIGHTVFANSVLHAHEKAVKLYHGEVKSIIYVRKLTHEEALERLRKILSN